MLQDLKQRLAPALTQWRHKLLAAAWQALQSNRERAQQKHAKSKSALAFWTNQALAAALATWKDFTGVGSFCAVHRSCGSAATVCQISLQCCKYALSGSSVRSLPSSEGSAPCCCHVLGFPS